MLNEPLPSRSKQLLSYTIIFLTAVYPLHPAWGAAMTAADKNTQISQQNNIPIINIATPNGAGISHNKFQDFNLDKQGAVLNNATTNVNSQIAGQIKTNANLKGNAANLIINEVIGSSRSELQGKLEVAGKGANVLIANPNGITCNGCSFVNTPAITLTTGKPILDNKGALSAVEVKKGSVIIGANGMNAEAQTYADIISRATELNGQIKAKNLTLMQGTNRVDFQKGTVAPIAGEGAKPSISVDTKALGGMYANQVKLVSTEAGVGVNLSNIQTSQGDLTLTVDGKITLAGNIQAKNDINVSTKNLQINANAKVNAAKDITLATNALTNNGQVIAGKDMRVFADTVSNAGNGALIQAQDNLWMQKNAKGDLSTLIENKSGTIKTNAGDLVVRTKALNNQRETLVLKQILSLKDNKDADFWLGDFNTAIFMPNLGGVYAVVIEELAKIDSNIKWVGHLDFKKSLYLLSDKQSLILEKDSKSGELSSGKNAYINANQLNNNQSLISAKNNLILTGSDLLSQTQALGEKQQYLKFNPKRGDPKIVGADAKRVPGISYYGKNVYDFTSTRSDNRVIVNRYLPAKFSAGNNFVADFSNKIELQTSTPFATTGINYLVQGANKPNIIEANNVLINANLANIQLGITSRNDTSLITKNNVNLDNANFSVGNNLTIIATEAIQLNQTALAAKNSTLVAKNGDIQYSSNTIPVFENNALSLSSINVTGSNTFNAGKNIIFNNIQLSPSGTMNLSTNGDIKITRHESGLLTQLPAGTPPPFNELMKKTGTWASSGDMNLTAGKNIEAQGITFNSGQALTLNAGQDILLGSKAIKDVDNLFKTNRYPELRSQLIANGNMTLNSARDIDLQAANVQSKGTITVLSGRNLSLLASAYSALPNPNEDYQDVRYVAAQLSGDKGVTLASNGALTAQGSTIKSLGDITISSGGNIRLESVKTHYRKQEGKRLEDLYRQIGTEINSGKTLTILSEGSILFQASRLVAKSTMDIAAKGGYLYAQAMEETSHYEEQSKKCNKWTLCITKKEVKKTRSETTNKVTEFTAEGDINLLAKDDVTLEATKINTGKNAKITSQTGKVNFKAVKNTTFEQVISNSKGFYITQRNKGYTEDKWILPTLHIGGKLTINAAKGITADIKAKNAQSLQNALNSLGQTEGTKWLSGLKDSKDVQWNLVQDAYDSWDYKSQSLNPVASALIMIAVTAMTSGYGLASWAADGAVTTTGATGITANVISGAAYSGMSALTSQAAVALVENQGNLSKALNTLGKSDTVKSIITQMVISGALNGLDVKMEWTKGNPGDAKLPLLANDDWNKVAQRVAAQSVISSTVNTTIQGGSFTDNFKNALLSNIGNQVNAEGARLIGDNGEILGRPGKVISHAALSGLSAEIKQANSRGAIVGALAAELAAISLGDNTIKAEEWQKKSEAQAQFARAFGGFAGAIFTGNAGGVYSGADAAETTFRYNYLSHKQQELMEKELATEPNIFKKGSIYAKWGLVSNTQDGALAAGFISGVPTELYDSVVALIGAVYNGEETLDALRYLINSENIFDTIYQAEKVDILKRLDAIELSYETAGINGAFNAGLAAGELTTKVVGYLAIVKGAASASTKTIDAVNKFTKVNKDIVSSKPEWLISIENGNKFNAEQAKNYPYNEIYVNKADNSGYYRVDSFNPIKGEIVSRKFTQFSDIETTTAKSYINEAVKKYSPGTVIATVPSSGSLAGKQLQGTLILEVPPQVKPIPKSIMDHANEAGIVIRDTNGKVYK